MMYYYVKLYKNRDLVNKENTIDYFCITDFNPT